MTNTYIATKTCTWMSLLYFNQYYINIDGINFSLFIYMWILAANTMVINFIWNLIILFSLFSPLGISLTLCFLKSFRMFFRKIDFRHRNETSKLMFCLFVMNTCLQCCILLRIFVDIMFCDPLNLLSYEGIEKALVQLQNIWICWYHG